MPDDPHPVIDVDAEVLPPDGNSGRKDSRTDKDAGVKVEDADNTSQASRIVATWMDELIRIPGTNIRIGLDPIIGLFPGIGDFLASSIGLVTLTEGVRLRVPLSALFRMGFNVLINDAIGTIPVIGDVFSVWFKSNSRNLKLINQWKAGEKAAVRRGSRIFLCIFFVVWFGQILLWLTLWLTLAAGIFRAANELFGT